MAINLTGKAQGLDQRQPPVWLALLLACILLFGAAASQASLTATVDRREISDADLLTLRVRLDNSPLNNNSIEPDFSVLDRDFEIVDISGPQKTSRTSIINGNTTAESYTLWELTLRPRSLGTLTIPPLTAGRDRSAPVTVAVVAQTAAMQRRASQYVFFDTSVDATETYVQGQVLYTVKLFYADATSGDFPAPPVLADAVVEPLEAERRYTEIVNNRRYNVLEKRYAIYPQKSGELLIPRETFAGSRSRSGFFSAGDRVTALSEPLKVNVKPKPESFPGANWLPAKGLVLTERWSQNPPVFKVGEPLNRTLTLNVEGVAGSLLPPMLSLDINNAKTYEDPPTLEEVVTPLGIVATQTYTIGIVPTAPGTLNLPAIRLPWWNTQTNKLAWAEIPARRYDVAPATETAAIAPLLPPTLADNQASIPGTGVAVASSSPLLLSVMSTIAAVFALLWAATLWLWWRARQAPAVASPQTAPATFSHPGNAEQYQRFSQACQHNDAVAARQALFLWGKSQYPQINSNHELGQLLQHGDSRLASEIANLERNIYAADPQQAWTGAGLLAALNGVRAVEQQVAGKKMLVGELNPL